MITDVGHIAAWIALAFCLYAAGVSMLGARRNDDRLVQSGRTAATLTFPLLLLACTGLWVALLTHDFSVKYVAEVSSISTPLFFRITALWGSQNGSILFWCLIMSGFIFFAASREWRDEKPLLPYVIAVMSLVLAFFIATNLIVTNPFARTDFPPDDGRGLNPLLRHPGMIIHPPMLYAGLTGFIVPFAFCMASLITRRRDNLWLLASRRWTLVGWAFLTAGLILGGRWAHDVLGWGGYWGWDPVENKSLIPWLLGTAFLHSAMIQEKRGMFKNWNVFLMLATFLSTIWGTAIVRSGILTSVHAFAQSSLGPVFLGFIALTLAVCLYLWFSRLEVLESDRRMDSLLSREAIFVLQNIIFVSAALSTFAGTTLPILTEAIAGVKVTVGPPWYNQIVVPQLALLVLLMGIAPLFAWGRASTKALGRLVLWPALAAVASVIVMVALGARSIPAVLAIGIALYTLAQTLFEYARGALARRAALGEPLPWAFINMVRRNQRRYGGYLVHLGVTLIAIGAAGKGYFGTDVVRNVDLNGSFSTSGYTFTYRGLQGVPCQFDDCQTVQAALQVTGPSGEVLGGVYPHRDSYPDQQQTASIADTIGGFNEEVYVILSAWEGIGSNASFQVYVNPMINWIWLGGVVMILGFLVAFWNEASPVAEARVGGLKPAAARAAVVLLLLAGAFLATGPVIARAQDADPNVDEPTYRIAKMLNCPTCTGRNLADCSTDTCSQWKNEIRTQLREGRSSDEILASFRAQFGETVLQEPPKEGASLILWVVPIAGFVVLLTGGAFVLKRHALGSAPALSADAAGAPLADDPYARALEAQVKE